MRGGLLNLGCSRRYIYSHSQQFKVVHLRSVFSRPPSEASVLKTEQRKNHSFRPYTAKNNNGKVPLIIKLRVRLSAEREASSVRRGVSRQDFRVQPTPVSAREIAECGDTGEREMLGWASPQGHLSRTHGHWASSDLSRTHPGPPLLPNIRRPSRTNTKEKVRVGSGGAWPVPVPIPTFAGVHFFSYLTPNLASLRSGEKSDLKFDLN